MRYLLILLFFALCFSSCIKNKPTSDTPLVEVQKTQSNDIRQYLKRVAGEITQNSLSGINSKEDWKNIQSKRYKEFIEMISLEDMPLKGERPPLNVKITGTIQKEGYRIENLYYESLPGLYVPANLYIPDNITEPTAAILYLCGHSRTQKVRYQTHAQKFAKLGFVCLIPETIQWGEVRGEHWGCYANGWFNWYSRGYTPAGVEVWNGIRGLDLLSERSEVDPENMGATGISGGGAISWFLAAVEPRIKAVAPVCGASTVEAQVSTRTIDGHCDCIVCINTYGWDFQDIGALIAPRALLIGQADRDGLNQVESVQKIYADLKAFYGLLGAPENVSYIETPGGHSYHKNSRELIFSFFTEQLKGIKIAPEEAGDIDESPESLASIEELTVYTQGPPPDDITTEIQDSFIKIPAPPQIKNVSQLTAYRDSVKDFLLKRTFHNFPQTTSALEPKQIFRTNDHAPFGKEVFHIATEEDWSLKVDIYWRHPKTDKKPMMVILRSPDEKKGTSEDYYYELNPEWNVAIFDARGIGESGWAPELQWHIRRAAAWTGRTIASMRVYDVLRCLEFCRSLPGTDSEKLGITAKGALGAVALYAALLDGKCSTLVLEDPPATQDIGSQKDGRGESIELLNCLRITDVNQIPALLYPAKTIFIGKIPESYDWSLKSLGNIGKADLIKTVDAIEDI